jgi:hypothetical protein
MNTKSIALLYKINDQLLQMVMILPQIAVPNPIVNPKPLVDAKPISRPILDENDVFNGNGNGEDLLPLEEFQ